MSRHAENNKFLSPGEQDALASFLVISSGFVVAINFLLFTWPPQAPVVALDIIYILTLPGYILLLSKRSGSQPLKRSMFIVGIASMLAIFLLLTGFFGFLATFH
jgi:hypothetical protein